MSEGNDKIKVLFLCTGNACRSQIAQGWARHLKGGVIDAYSAGVAPAGVISQRAVKVMAEAGVDISSQTSKHIDDLADIDFDYVVTVCDNARENCPVLPGAKSVHRPFEDPSFMVGTDQQVIEAFRKTRDQIKAFIEQMPEILETKSG